MLTLSLFFSLLVAATSAQLIKGGTDACAGVTCPTGQTCQPDAKQCVTTPCPQYRCTTPALPTAGPTSSPTAEPTRGKCYTCATPGITSFFDGCNSCSCGNGVPLCTKKACILSLPDPSSCSRQCDGFVTTDGCLCIGSTKTKCPMPTAPSSTSVVGTKPPSTAAPKPCDAKPCASDEICVNEPKQCVTTPCPQYACKRPQKCGCDNIGANCQSGFTCQANRCVPLTPPMLPAGVLDGTPLCVRTGGSCCGGGFVCAADEVCEQSACIKKTACPAQTLPTATEATSTEATKPEDTKLTGATKPVVVGGDSCVTCATPGVTAFFDGCNQCDCGRVGGVPLCTKRACIALAPDPAQCSLRCDGAKTTEEPVCGVSESKNGQKTKCTKCSGTCSTNEAGRPVCSSATQAMTRGDIDSEPGSATKPATVAITALLAALAMAM